MLEDLQQRFPHPDVAFHQDANGLIYLQVNTTHCDALISLYAGQLLSFRPKNQQQDLFFISKQAYKSQGKAIKGGVPVCWPWFGDAPATLPGKNPAHGFVRSQWWTLKSIENKEDNLTIQLNPKAEAVAAAGFGHLSLTLTLRLGESCELILETENHSQEHVSLSQGFHSYFLISDVKNIELQGFAGKNYLDKTKNFAELNAAEEPLIDQEIDRIYLECVEGITMIDKGFSRRLTIHSNSANVVLWNPWQEKAAAMADFGDSEYLQMLCIENIHANQANITLAPGERMCLSAHFELSSL